MTILSIDPGGVKSAAWGLLDPKYVYTGEFEGIQVKSKILIDARKFYVDVLDVFEPTFVCIENVNCRPGQGISSQCDFMKNTGILIGAVMAYGCELIHVAPQTWKKDMGVLKQKGDTPSEAKKRSLVKARELFPDMVDQLSRVKDHNRAEALLIARWASENT